MTVATETAAPAVTTETVETKLQKSIALVKDYKSKCGANIQINKGGGIFLRHPTFQAWSVSKDKAYTASININVEVLRALLDNKLLMAEVREFLKCVPSTLGMNQEEMAEFIATYQKEKKA